MISKILSAGLGGALILLTVAEPALAARGAPPGAARAVAGFADSRPFTQVQRRTLSPSFNSAAQPRFSPPPPVIRPPVFRPPVSQPSMPRLGPAPGSRMQFAAPQRSYFGSTVDPRRRGGSPSLMRSPMQRPAARRPAMAFNAMSRPALPARGVSGMRATFRAATLRQNLSAARAFRTAARPATSRVAFNRAARLSRSSMLAFNAAAAGPAKAGVSRSSPRSGQTNIYDHFRRYLDKPPPSGFAIVATSRRAVIVRSDATAPGAIRGAAGRLARTKLQFGSQARLAENVLLARIANQTLRIHAERATAHIKAIPGDKIVLGRGGHFEKVAKAAGVKPYQPDQAQYEALKKVGREFEPNRRFLDDAIRRGARIFLASPPSTAGHASDFRREIDHLRKAGYRLSDDGLEMVRR